MAEIFAGLIRRYAERDLDDICFIERSYYLRPATREELSEKLRNPSWVAEEDQQVIGHVITCPDVDKTLLWTLIWSIVIAAPHRSKGIGSLLIETVHKKMKGPIALYVEPRNPARRFYKKHGYIEVASLANFYGQGYDAVRMEKRR
jgi:ribosomal protein S18 acetylase RimI-like enzyme